MDFGVDEILILKASFDGLTRRVTMKKSQALTISVLHQQLRELFGIPDGPLAWPAPPPPAAAAGAAVAATAAGGPSAAAGGAVDATAGGSTAPPTPREASSTSGAGGTGISVLQSSSASTASSWPPGVTVPPSPSSATAPALHSPSPGAGSGPPFSPSAAQQHQQKLQQQLSPLRPAGPGPTAAVAAPAAADSTATAAAAVGGETVGPALLVTYTDVEGDAVALVDDRDLKDALFLQKLNPLRLQIRIDERPNPTVQKRFSGAGDGAVGSSSATCGVGDGRGGSKGDETLHVYFRALGVELRESLRASEGFLSSTVTKLSGMVASAVAARSSLVLELQFEHARMAQGSGSGASGGGAMGMGNGQIGAGGAAGQIGAEYGGLEFSHVTTVNDIHHHHQHGFRHPSYHLPPPPLQVPPLPQQPHQQHQQQQQQQGKQQQQQQQGAGTKQPHPHVLTQLGDPLRVTRGPGSPSVRGGGAVAGAVVGVDGTEGGAGRNMCSICRTSPIVGPRYVSLIKADYELCYHCFATHGLDGSFQKMAADPTAAAVSTPDSVKRSSGGPPGSLAGRPFGSSPRGGPGSPSVHSGPLARGSSGNVGSMTASVPVGTGSPDQVDVEGAAVMGGGGIGVGVPVHEGIECDLCRMCPIVGPRYKSAVLPDYDLCQECYSGEAEKNCYDEIFTPIDPSPRTPATGLKILR